MPAHSVRWIAAFLAIGFFMAVSAAPVAAQSGPDETKLRDEIASLEEKTLRAQAEVEVLKVELRLVPNRPPADSPSTAKDLATAEQVLRKIRAELDASHTRRRDALRDLVKKAKKGREKAIAGLNETRKANFEVHQALAGAQAREANAAKGRFDFGLVLIFLWGLIVLAAGVLLGMHVLRVSLRQRWRSGLTASLLLTFTLALGPALAQTTGQRNLEQERDRLKVDLDPLLSEAKTLAIQVEERRAAILRTWAKMLTAPKNDTHQQFVDWEVEDYKLLHDLLVETRLTKLALAKGQELLKQASADSDLLAGIVSAEHQRHFIRRAIKAGACIGFPLLALIPIYIARKKARKRLAKEADQCPCCLAVGCLEEKVATVQDERYPEPRFYYCPQCAYEFRASYRKLPRICLPTVGVPSSGKTHWLVSAYDLVKNNNVGYGVESSIQRGAPSLADETFDQLIEVVLESHQNPAATTHGQLPSPLTFHLSDVDQLGPSKTLLNLFDCSGEIMYSNINTDVVRRRALMMDGFLLFIDPTQVSRHGPTPGLDAQINRLASFHAEMRDIRGLDVGDRIDVPIAVCMSKLDLLITRNPLRGQARPMLSKLRGTIGVPPTLEILQQRSRLIEDVLPVMLPGWDVVKTLRENFGSRYLFFPMTPVGMEESELGIEDLRHRTIVPFGILEPVLWLLYMRGYSVLPTSAKGGR